LATGRASGIHVLVEALCTRVEGLRRLRLSSLEPGDLTDELIGVFQRLPQVVPHFHLPLQSGSDRILRRMNRQYTRDDFLDMAGRVKRSFDRPAITTDVIVGFPGETDDEFRRTLEVVDRVGFLHVHAFPFSPRPATAAARWAKDFVRGTVVNERIGILNGKAADFSLKYRRQFVGEVVEVIAEGSEAEAGAADRRGNGALALPARGQSLVPLASPGVPGEPIRHGRCERYFSVWFDGSESLTGKGVRVRIDRVTARRTLGTLVGVVP
jgi:MiaB/RimO family radical SAM methylthiotransferase